MEYFDSQLNKYSGSYFLYFMPDYRFDYYNGDYKVNNVVKATIVNQKKEKINVKEYDSEGFLIAEMRYDNNDNSELHNYSYTENRRVIIDSMAHIIFRVDSIMLLPVKPPKKDTVYHIEKRFFNANNQLDRAYNIFTSTFYKTYLKERAFYPDSFFYHYDQCGNCDQLTWYANGERNTKTQKYYYTNISSLVNVDHADGYGSEVWKFNPDTQITEISTDYEHIVVKYNEAKKVKFYEYTDLKSSYTKHDPGATPYKKTTHYYYDNKSRLSKIRIYREDEDPNLKEDKWTIMKRYDNGLLQTDFSSNIIYYTYKY